MRTVLIVEDDRTTNDRLKNLLREVPDVDVVQVYDRASAERELRSRDVALLVADVRLGEGRKDKLTGLSLLKVIGDKPTIAIVVSGMPEDLVQEMAFTMEAFDFISKPIKDAEFLHKVEQALDAHEALQSSTAGASRGSWPTGLTADPRRKLQLRWKNRPVALSLTHLRLVHALLESIGQVVPYGKLGMQLKEPTSSPKLVSTQMTHVRRAFENADSAFEEIDNEPGKGYFWRAPPK